MNFRRYPAEENKGLKYDQKYGTQKNRFFTFVSDAKKS
jgi:hypothetical protein